jgi:hypothetical protein
VSVLSVAAIVATAPTAVIVRTVAFALPVVVVPLLVASAVLLPARMTVVSVTTTAVTATGPEALSMATAR